MRKYIFFFLASLWSNLIAAQADIKFDNYVYDFGTIAEKTMITKEFHFTNTGNDSLIISDAGANDGISKVIYPKEPIGKGKSGIIKFSYYATRIGKIDKDIYVNSNAPLHPQVVLTLTGDVVFDLAEIKADSLVKHAGQVKFNNADTVVFYIYNTGHNNLHISFPYYLYHESDLLWLRIKSVKSKYIPDYVPDGYIPGDTLQVMLSLKNVYGNTGPFERRLYFLYNSHDTLMLNIKGDYTGTPSAKKIIDGYPNWYCIVYNYKEDKIASMQEYDYMGRLYSESFYDNSNCMHKKNYDAAKGKLKEEYYYKDGKQTVKNVF